MAAKAELFKIPLFGKSLTAFGFFPLARNSPANTAMTLKSMAKRFSQGGSVWMAPEGTRQVQPKIGNFKPGAFFLALKTQQTLVPIVIYGTHNVLPKNPFPSRALLLKTMGS
jgi:1-acyl-sn-glycerol-3-phosphate acyltransferase